MKDVAWHPKHKVVLCKRGSSDVDEFAKEDVVVVVGWLRDGQATSHGIWTKEDVVNGEELCPFLRYHDVCWQRTR